MCPLAEHLQQYQSSPCLHLMSDLLISCFIQHHYGCDGFFGEVVGKKYSLYLPSAYGVKCLGEVYNNSVPLIFVAASHQTGLDTRSKARRPIKAGIKGRGRSGTSRDSNTAGLCCSTAHLVQCEPDEASSFTNPNVGPGTYAGLWLELDSNYTGSLRASTGDLPQ